MSLMQRKGIAQYGVDKYLRKNGFKTTRRALASITAIFLKSKGLPHSWFNPNYKGINDAGANNSYRVQDHWGEFCEFLKSGAVDKFKIN